MRVKRKLLVGLVVVATSFATAAVTAPAAEAAYGCGSAISETHTDFQGAVFTKIWYCGNAASTTMYAGANYNTSVAYMDTTYSWFVCWRSGVWHAGGNNIWYYSQGDRVISNGYRRAWGFIPAVNVWTTRDPHPEMPQCPADAPPPPARTNGLNKPVYFVHGYKDGVTFPATVSAYWGGADGMINDFKADEPPGQLSAGNVVTFCYYSSISGCTRNIGGTQTRPIKDVAKDLAWDIYNHYSRYGQAVDIVAHSMGGLVARAAITGTSNGEPGFPAYIYVEDAVTIVTPNAGVEQATWALCWLANTRQCDDMRDANFLNWLQAAPASRIHTDWTYIGTEDDPIISENTAVPDSHWVGHKVIFTANQFLPLSSAHMAVLDRTSGLYTYKYCHLNYSRSVDPFCQNKSSSAWSYASSSWDPSRLVQLAVYYKDSQ